MRTGRTAAQGAFLPATRRQDPSLRRFVFSGRGEGTINLSKGRLRQLTARDRAFLKNVFVGRMGQTEAYLEAIRRPDGTCSCSPATAKVSASRMMSRLRRNPALFADILKAVEIDDYTLAGDLHRMRTAQRTEFYQGEIVATVEDNGTQMRAVELIADILGHRKAAVELSGVLGLKGYIGVSPDDWPDKAEPGTDKDEPEAPAAVPSDA